MTERDGFWAFVMLSPNLTGLSSFKEMLVYDKIVGQIVRNTLVYTASAEFTGMFLSLMLAIAPDRKIKLVRVFRAAFFMPVVTSSVAVSLVSPSSARTERYYQFVKGVMLFGMKD